MTTLIKIHYLGVQAATGVGIGFVGLEEVLGVLDIPCMTSATYSAHQKVFQKDVSAVCKEKMFEAAMDAKSIAISKGNVDEDGTPLLTVSADACFSKRTYGVNSSYSSLSAAGSIVSHDTGKVIWSGVANKFCMKCSKYEKSDAVTPNSMLLHL